VFLYSKTDPIIEASHGMRLAPFNAAYPGLGAHMLAARLEPRHNHWRRVFDFSAGDARLPQPHWEALPEAQWAADWAIEGAELGLPPAAGPPENPVPRDAAPKDEGSAGVLEGVQAFDIRAGMAAGQAALAGAGASAGAGAGAAPAPAQGPKAASAPALGGAPRAPGAAAPGGAPPPPAAAPAGANSFFARLAAQKREAGQ